MPEREEQKCKVILLEESDYQEKPSGQYFDNKRAIMEKGKKMHAGNFDPSLPEIIIEESETETADVRPSSFYSTVNTTGSNLSINNKRNPLGGSNNSIAPEKETCLVTFDISNMRRSRLLQLKGDLSNSAFSLVRRYMDMPKEVAASECGSIACIPAHIASNSQNRPHSSPHEKLIIAAKETVV